jgi:hypothetical protein
MVRRIPLNLGISVLLAAILGTAVSAAAQSETNNVGQPSENNSFGQSSGYGSGLGGFGLGFTLGEPSGVNGKIWTGPATAISGGLAWSLADGGATNLYGDVLWHNFDLFDLQNGYLPLYFGFGGRLQFEEDTHFGLRGVVGLDYIFPSSPIDAFLELVPIVDIAPEGDLTFNATVGARYFFR